MDSGTRGERCGNTTEAGGPFYKPTSARHPTNPRSWARSRTPILHQLRRNQTLGHRELGPPASRNPFMALGPASSGTLLHKASCAGATWPGEQPPGQTLDTEALRAACSEAPCVRSRAAAASQLRAVPPAPPGGQLDAGSLLLPRTLGLCAFPARTFSQEDAVAVIEHPSSVTAFGEPRPPGEPGGPRPQPPQSTLTARGHTQPVSPSSWVCQFQNSHTSSLWEITVSAGFAHVHVLWRRRSFITMTSQA